MGGLDLPGRHLAFVRTAMEQGVGRGPHVERPARACTTSRFHLGARFSCEDQSGARSLRRAANANGALGGGAKLRRRRSLQRCGPRRFLAPNRTAGESVHGGVPAAAGRGGAKSRRRRSLQPCGPKYLLPGWCRWRIGRWYSRFRSTGCGNFQRLNQAVCARVQYHRRRK